MQSIRTASDIVLRNRTFEIACNPKYDAYQKGTLLSYKLF